jgi:hypothetical protein
LQEYGFWAPVSVTDGKDSRFWTPQEIANSQQKLSLKINDTSSNYGLLTTVDGEERSVVYNPGLEGTHQYLAALKGSSIWLSDNLGRSWTMQEIENQGFSLNLDPQHPNRGWLTINKQKVEVKLIDTNSNSFGGYVEVGQDGENAWVNSVASNRNMAYTSETIDTDSLGIVTKKIQYYTPQGTIYGSDEVNT